MSFLDIDLLDIELNVLCPNKNAISAIDENSVGYKLHLWINNNTGRLPIQPGNKEKIRTGVHVKIPHEYWGTIQSMPDLFLNRNIFVVDSIVNNKFDGELYITVWNPTEVEQVVSNGENLAQLILHKNNMLPMD